MRTGDQVRLNIPASPLMLVIGPARYGGFHCVWFINGEERKGFYPEEALRVVGENATHPDNEA